RGKRMNTAGNLLTKPVVKMASIMEGPLSKWTNVMKGWQYRWFVLDYNAGLLSYYTSKDKMMRGSRRGCVRLKGAVIGIDDEDDSTFTITVDQKTFHFQARDADEREKWIHALEGTILRHTLQLQEAEAGFVPSVQDFDKKLSEADAYLQILIDQLKVGFDHKNIHCFKMQHHFSLFFYRSLKVKAATINPVDGIYQPPLEIPVVNTTMPTQAALPTDASQVCKSDQRPSTLPVGPIVTVMGSLQTSTPNSTGEPPPISAFYAECLNRKIQFNAHIWTKSKFLGMSIGVHNIGQGCVSCLEHDEHYILTFPNGYGRSILTVPWVELGGECNISCSKSGYSANIVFHTKPFYGGKKHRITADIFAPNDKKSFCSIEGEWNGVMYAKWATGENTAFIDTKKIGIVKKKVRKLEDQLDYESRRLWRDVTVNLKLKDIDAATDAKHRLEEKQRAEARERKEKEQQWETRLFHEDGECWVYDEPLLKRLPTQRP
uniref:Oxysterol binding protein-like 9 n=1 Tax=Oryzias sinensis TaxID=183150 RepID=A0A8C7YM26_9TELE